MSKIDGALHSIIAFITHVLLAGKGRSIDMKWTIVIYQTCDFGRGAPQPYEVVDVLATLVFYGVKSAHSVLYRQVGTERRLQRKKYLGIRAEN